MPLEHVRHLFEIARHHGSQLLRIVSLAEGRRADDVGEEDSYGLARVRYRHLVQALYRGGGVV
jgi:hypothetical protein